MRIILLYASLTCLATARPLFQFNTLDRAVSIDDSRSFKPKYSGPAVLLRPDYAVWNMLSVLKNYLGTENMLSKAYRSPRAPPEFNQQLKRLIGMRSRL
uniref:Pro-kuma_activ domain-containing protein n=1 Tax=Ascaris lumbricoides TaxID=6252 RepID=A0A0M3HXT7_ASCLU